MSRLTLGVVLLALAVGSTIAAAAGQPAAAPRILVGPNMLVSRDGDFPHVELILAANPKNAKNLLGGAITYTRPNGETYYARKWGEHTDVEVLKKARELGVNVYLSSVPGTGKTAAVEAAFGTDIYTVVDLLELGPAETAKQILAA